MPLDKEAKECGINHEKDNTEHDYTIWIHIRSISTPRVEKHVGNDLRLAQAFFSLMSAVSSLSTRTKQTSLIMKTNILAIGMAIAACLAFSSCKKTVTDSGDITDVNRLVGSYSFTETITYTLGTLSDKTTYVETETGAMTISKVSDTRLSISGWKGEEATYNPTNITMTFLPFTVTKEDQSIDVSAAAGGLDAKGKLLTIYYTAEGWKMIDGKKTKLSARSELIGTKK